MADLNEGDVFFWEWKDPQDDRRPYAYHCYSCIAVVKGGLLIDTYWHDMSSDRAIDPARVTLDLKGNLATLEHINPWTARYYRPEDVVDMRHANSSGADVYVKPGAKRDPDIMRELGEYLIQRAESEIRMAGSRIDMIKASLKRIDDGDAQSVEFPAA